MQIAPSEDLYFYPAIAIMINNKTKCTVLLTIFFLTLCWDLLTAVFNKGRKMTMKARLLVIALCIGGILLCQDTFDIPLGLPDQISRIINTIFGNGV